MIKKTKCAFGAVLLGVVFSTVACVEIQESEFEDEDAATLRRWQRNSELEAARYNATSERTKAEIVAVREASSPWDDAQVLGLLREQGVLNRLRTVGRFSWESEGVTLAMEDALLRLSGEEPVELEDVGERRVGRTESYDYLRTVRGSARLTNREVLFSDVAAAPGVGRGRIEGDVRRALDTIGVRFPRTTVVDVRDLIAIPLSRDGDGTVSEGEPEVVAFKTFVTMEIEGVPVRGARAVFGHFLDGGLQKAHVTWPRIRPGSYGGLSLADETASRRVATALRAHALGQGKRELEVSALYIVQEEQLRPAVNVRGKLNGPNGEERWSELVVPLE